MHAIAGDQDYSVCVCVNFVSDSVLMNPAFLYQLAQSITTNLPFLPGNLVLIKLFFCLTPLIWVLIKLLGTSTRFTWALKISPFQSSHQVGWADRDCFVVGPRPVT